MSVLQRLEIQDELDSFMEQREPPDDPLEDDDYAESIQGYIGGMHKLIAYGPQPTPFSTHDSTIADGKYNVNSLQFTTTMIAKNVKEVRQMKW